MSGHKNILKKRPFYIKPINFVLFPFIDGSAKEVDKMTNELINLEKKYGRIRKNDNGYYLPKGTLLYHGTLESTLVNHGLTFFGIDPEISLWYIHELVKEKQSYFDKNKIGYLYVFELIKDLPIDNLILDIHQNPKESTGFYIFKKKESICSKKVCVHPQSALIIGNDSYNQLFTEVTIDFSNNKYKDIIKLIDICVVDTSILEKNKMNKQFDPRDSIFACKKYKF